MKIEVNQESEIVLKEVYNGITLVSNAGEQFSICMRDSGFEFSYGGKKYEAKENKLQIIGCTNFCGDNYCDENGCTERKRCYVDELIPQTNGN
jgi:hypothetical protein